MIMHQPLHSDTGALYDDVELNFGALRSWVRIVVLSSRSLITPGRHLHSASCFLGELAVEAGDEISDARGDPKGELPISTHTP